MIIKGDKVIAGTIDKVNLEPIQEYIEKTIGVFSESAWNAMADEDKASYKLSLIYADDSEEAAPVEPEAKVNDN